VAIGGNHLGARQVGESLDEIRSLRQVGDEGEHLALISKVDGAEVVKNIPGFEDDMSRVIAATYPDAAGSAVRVIGAYFPNGQAPDSDKFVYKMRWLDALRDWVQDEMTRHPHLLLLGDYNITFDELDMWDPVALAGTIHCTDAEREKLQALVSLGLVDSFRLFEQPEKSYSWWDYREFGFRRNRGLRIDHILISDALKPRATACVIDRAPRKNERPSDHAPVVLTVF
jgi:exodeoxyribonuclease-3